MTAWLRAMLLPLACGVLCACAPSELHKAAIVGDVGVVRQWIRAGRNVDVDFNDHSFKLEGNLLSVRRLRPLMLAAESGHLEVVTALVEAGADVYAQSGCAGGGCEKTAFDYAVEKGHLDVARYLWEKSDRVRLGARLDLQLLSACVDSCNAKAGQDERTNLALFLAGIAPPQKLGRGIALLAASQLGSGYLAFLRSHGVKFPSNTLVDMASASPRRRSVETEEQRRDYLARAALLLREGADPNEASSERATTPLMFAASAGNVELIQLLLAHGADPNRQDASGDNAVAWAAGSCYGGPPQMQARVAPLQQAQLAVVDLLIAAGGRPEALGRGHGRLLREHCCVSAALASPPQAEICGRFGLR